MDIYMTIPEASRFSRISENSLYELIRSGRIKTVMLSTGAILLKKSDIQPQWPSNIEDWEEYQPFAIYAGEGISLSEAERLYGIPKQTLSRWANKGMIKRIGICGRSLLVDRAQVATLASLYRESGGHQGKWIFLKGHPYSKKQ